MRHNEIHRHRHTLVVKLNYKFGPESALSYLPACSAGAYFRAGLPPSSPSKSARSANHWTTTTLRKTDSKLNHRSQESKSAGTGELCACFTAARLLLWLLRLKWPEEAYKIYLADN